MVSCESVLENISALIDDDIDYPLRRQIHAHLNVCRRCAILHDTMCQMISIAGDENLFQVPAGFSNRLRSAVEKMKGPKMVRATLNGQTIAESDNTQMVDGYTYFPPESVKWEYLSPSPKQSVCHWKGTATYFHVKAGGQLEDNAAWCYSNPKPAAESVKSFVGFWKGVQVLVER